MDNWILCPVRNNLALTKEAMRTFLAQDIGNIRVLLIDNASSDGTFDWAQSLPNNVFIARMDPPAGVGESWNRGLEHIFGEGAEHALVVNNDVELRPDTYRWLLEDGGGFVTAVGVRERGQVFSAETHMDALSGYPVPNPAAKRPHPDFSCYLIRKDLYRTVGPYDEHFKVAFCEDWDYHCRMHVAGIDAYCLDVPFLHHASQTIKNAEPYEQEVIGRQADLNREYFARKWGFRGATKEYEDFFNTPREELRNRNRKAVQS